ncbi:hydroxycarboxylic acid receptor 1-like [Heptranchias perlo]|uniref:hydroxycarboxylic acid receptor 1-like n=1 Tax=Heptranchias perlo TaxID=212740 RepID=UPI00355A6E35
MANETQQCTSVEDINSSYNPPVIIITFILGFIGNVIALWIFCFHTKSFKPNTVYSLNLAIADTLLICCLPFRADYFVREKNWIFGDAACRVNQFFISLNRMGSIVFLTATAIDRYFKVVHPHHQMNKIPARCAVKVAGALWILAVTISLHLLTEHHDFKHNNLTYCEPFNMYQPLNPLTIWTDIVFGLFNFILPASIILYSTSCIIWKLKQMETEMRGKHKRAVKLVIAVAAVFIFCFLPTNIALLAVVITKQRRREDCKSYETAVQVFYNTLFMTYLNSVLDPVIYHFSSSTFNVTLKKALVPLNLNLFTSATSEGIQPREPKRELVLDQHLKNVPVCNTCDQSQTESTMNV